MRKLLFAVLAFFAVNAGAAIVGPIPNNLTNGTTIDAIPVMANYNWIMNQVNTNAAPIANPTFTGTVTMGGNVALGSNSLTAGAISGTTGTFSSYGIFDGIASGTAITAKYNGVNVFFLNTNAGGGQWDMYDNAGGIENLGLSQKAGKLYAAAGLAVTGTTSSTSFADSGGHLIISSTAPTIASGFGTSPSIVANNTAAFKITTGTANGDTDGVITLPAAPNGWVCPTSDFIVPALSALIQQIATTTTSATLRQETISGVATAWGTGEVLWVACTAF